MKIDRHGKAKILTQEEIQLLFSQGLSSERDFTLGIKKMSQQTPETNKKWSDAFAVIALGVLLFFLIYLVFSFIKIVHVLKTDLPQGMKNISEMTILLKQNTDLPQGMKNISEMTILLKKQNDLLETQNKQIEKQVELLEKQVNYLRDKPR